jgi:two-component system response regulator
MTTGEILLVDDNPADLDLIAEMLSRGEFCGQVRTVNDGAEAIAFLHRQGKYAGARLPDLILLDLNLPKKDGRAVLAHVKNDPALRKTPVVVFSTSQAARDVLGSYELGANSYVTKPGDLQEFALAVKSIQDFWFRCARLPQEEKQL